MSVRSTPKHVYVCFLPVLDKVVANQKQDLSHNRWGEQPAFQCTLPLIRWTHFVVNHFLDQRIDISHLTTQDLREIEMKGDEVHMCDASYSFHLFPILLFPRTASARQLSFPVSSNYKNNVYSQIYLIFCSKSCQITTDRLWSFPQPPKMVKSREQVGLTLVKASSQLL